MPGNVTGQVSLPKKHIAYLGNYLLHRLDFRKKNNQYLKELPRVILRAYCEGKLNAYFPGAPDKPVAYSEFLAHFGMPELALSQLEKFESFECTGNLCLETDPWILNCFSIYADILEVQRFDKNRSQYSYDIKYINLVFSSECTGNGLDYMGPVFKFDDLVKVSGLYTVKNPLNDADEISLARIFLERKFQTDIIEQNGEPIKNAKEAQKIKEKREKKDEASWEY
ncbi:MAG: hypothetical protein A3H98_04080 [Bacteroidetes bacterium RIFCSPLOWO2_02_FULL_36_8]|nr:MAG: hypothetical protein A3H98_04080 [Bacteroidetes bacterium RIFCSPLOWO2_02_FULL_36_8]